LDPIAPFYAERLYRDLNAISGKEAFESVHLSDFPSVNQSFVDKTLETQMEYAQKISSLVLSLRKKENIKVRQPLQKILIPVVDPTIKEEIIHVKELILAEVNVKELEFMEAIDKSIKPNFKTLGKKVGSKMKALSELILQMPQIEIEKIEEKGSTLIILEGESIEILRDDVEIISKEISGYKVANEGKITVALDINVTEHLREEGIARELVSKLQGLRKELDFNLIDKISVKIVDNNYFKSAINQFKTYICSEILATDISLVAELSDASEILVDEISIKVTIEKA
jgi:isoleucyl-tRNA synthetase